MHVIHEWAWAGTPNEGAAWLRLQRLADTWHRILLIPVTGGVIVGMMHGLLEILEQIKPSNSSKSSQRQGFDVLGGVFPTIKAIQAAVTLGTGCSLGPEGPSVDIGKSCAHGCYLMMENNRERMIALVAAGAAAGIASGTELPGSSVVLILKVCVTVFSCTACLCVTVSFPAQHAYIFCTSSCFCIGHPSVLLLLFILLVLFRLSLLCFQNTRNSLSLFIPLPLLCFW